MKTQKKQGHKLFFRWIGNYLQICNIALDSSKNYKRVAFHVHAHALKVNFK